MPPVLSFALGELCLEREAAIAGDFFAAGEAGRDGDSASTASAERDRLCTKAGWCLLLS